MKLTKRDFMLLAVIVYFTFIGGTFYSQFNFLLRIANQVIVTVILVGWLLRKLKQKEGLPRTLLDAGIGLYVIANFISVFFGQSWRFSLENLWFTITHVLAFYLLVNLIRSGWAQKVIWAVYMAAAVVCLVGWAEFIAWYVGAPLFGGFAQGWFEIGGWRNPIPPTIYRLNITLNGSTPLAAYLSLLIPPAIGLILTLPPKNQNRQALILWLALLAIPVQILTFSRAGILALAISLSLLAVGWVFVCGKRRRDLSAYWQRLSLKLRVVVIFSGLVALGLGLFWVQYSFDNRVGSTNFRITLWQAAIIIFERHWFTGAGPGNFGRALLRLNTIAFPRRQIFTAHNIYLNTAAELGLTGLLAGAYLYFMVAYSWLQHWRHLTSVTEKIRLIAAGSALVGLAAQLLVDTYSATPNILVMLLVLAYVVAPLPAAGISKLKEKSAGRQPLAVTGSFSTSISLSLVSLVLLLTFLLGFFWIALADFRFQNSFRHERAGNLKEAVTQAEQSYRLDPALTLRLFRLALLEARLAHQTNNPALAQSAIKHYQTGLQQEPIFGLNSANLAGLLWQQGRPTEAIAMMERSIVADQNSLYWLNLGYFYEQQQDWDNASAAYGRVLALSPDLAGSGFWQASTPRAERWPDFVDRAVSSDDELAQKQLLVRLALAQEDFDAVEDLLGAMIPDASDPFYSTWIEVYLNRGQVRQAEALLNSIPSSSDDYLWRGRLKLQVEDDVSAEKALKAAVFLKNQAAHYYLGQLYERQGDLQAAKPAYRRAMASATAEDIEVAIYGRLGGNDMAPQLMQIGNRRQIKPVLSLVRLYETEQDAQAVNRMYNLLKEIDYFFVEP